MKKNIFRISSILIAFFSIANSRTFAAAGMVGQAKVDTSSPAVAGITNAGSSVAGIIAAIGVAVALVILLWLGIKYIMASPSDKADIKKSAVAYIIGAVVLFAASGILALIAGFADNLFAGGGGDNLRDQGYPSSMQGY